MPSDPDAAITAFVSVPAFARGQVRDRRVRWALEEAGLPFRRRLVRQGDQDTREARLTFIQTPAAHFSDFEGRGVA